MEYRAVEYIEKVLAGEIITGKLSRLAVERHVKDLAKQDSENFQFYFDEESAKFAIDFFSFLRHTKGRWAGKPVILEPWQQFILWCIYGWKRKETGLRRFHVVYIEVARKNGKSTKLAGLGLMGIVADGEAEAEVYSAATKKTRQKSYGNRPETWSKIP